MNLLEEITAANERVRERKPEYKGPMDGHCGTGANDVLKELSPEARKKWQKTHLADSVLIMAAANLNAYALACGVDLTKI